MDYVLSIIKLVNKLKVDLRTIYIKRCRGINNF